MTTAKIVIKEVAPGKVAMQMFAYKDNQTYLELRAATLLDRVIAAAFEMFAEDSTGKSMILASSNQEMVQQFAEECIKRAKEKDRL